MENTVRRRPWKFVGAPPNKRGFTVPSFLTGLCFFQEGTHFVWLATVVNQEQYLSVWIAWKRMEKGNCSLPFCAPGNIFKLHERYHANPTTRNKGHHFLRRCYECLYTYQRSFLAGGWDWRRPVLPTWEPPRPTPYEKPNTPPPPQQRRPRVVHLARRRLASGMQ